MGTGVGLEQEFGKEAREASGIFGFFEEAAQAGEEALSLIHIL